MARHPQSALHRIAAENGGVDGRTAFLARQVGDAAGGEVVRQYIHYLAIGVGNIVNIFFPEVVALSGGIANQGENLLAPPTRGGRAAGIRCGVLQKNPPHSLLHPGQ